MLERGTRKEQLLAPEFFLEVGEQLPGFTQDIQFTEVLEEYKVAVGGLKATEELVVAQVQAVRTPLTQAQLQLQGARTTLEETQSLVKKGPVSPTDMDRPFILNQVRTLLGDPTVKLPFLLKWARVFGIAEHPALVEARDVFSHAQSQYGIAEQRFVSDQTTIRESTNKRLEGRRRDVKTAEGNLFRFLDTSATQSLDTARRYVELVPSRVNQVADLYARKIETTPQELADFNDFLRRELKIRENLDQEQRAKWYGRSYPFLVNGNNPTPEEYERYIAQGFKDRWHVDRRRKVIALLTLS